MIRGLEALKRRSHVELFTDSEYVRQGLSQWMPKWKANGWRAKKGRDGNTEIKNLELWQRLDELIAGHRIKFTRVAGHSGHPENDRCDELAVAAYQQFMALKQRRGGCRFEADSGGRSREGLGGRGSCRAASGSPRPLWERGWG